MEKKNKDLVNIMMKHSYNFFFHFVLFVFFFVPSRSISVTDYNSFAPSVNYLIDCGSPVKTQLNDGRNFKSDRETTSLLSTTEDIILSVDSINITNIFPPSSLPLYQTARAFTDESIYTFYMSKTGRIWIRLYFFPFPNPSYNLTSSIFSVHTDHFVLLHEFSPTNNNSFYFKEYLVNVPDTRFSLKFKPNKDSLAFINAIEIVSAPDTLISDSATQVFPLGEFKGLMNSALQVSYRINVGGITIAPEDDTLSRTWEPDGSYNIFPQGSMSFSVSNRSIKYPEQNGVVHVTPLIAPNSVYASCVQMKDPKVMQPNFNLSWMVNVEKRYSYLIRMHFCDIVSKSLNQLYFNVYINGIEGVHALDLSSQTKALSTAFYKDFVIGSSNITNGSILIQVGPPNLQLSTTNAILNGIEVMKMSNSADSLDGFFSVDGEYIGPNLTSKVMKIVAIVGLVLAVIALLLLAIMYIRWLRRPLDWEECRSLSSWILPLHSRCKKSCKTNSNTTDSSPKSKNGGHHSPRGPEKFFHFVELQRATNNFDEKRVIGVGGFGKVYLGTLEDGTDVAIKRGTGGSGQGMNEFITELNMLSKMRHRHLVSLIGFCDENSEMVLVYDYMSNGPFRSHLYGSNISPLSWQKRLEICIGAARGLHYLHTGNCYKKFISYEK
jgi:hypothetical protein